jgi:hypothetical protein
MPERQLVSTLVSPLQKAEEVEGQEELEYFKLAMSC